MKLFGCNVWMIIICIWIRFENKKKKIITFIIESLFKFGNWNKKL